MPAHLSRPDGRLHPDTIDQQDQTGLHYDPVVVLTVLLGILVGTILVTSF